jgi:hypothetical protein
MHQLNWINLDAKDLFHVKGKQHEKEETDPKLQQDQKSKEY